MLLPDAVQIWRDSHGDYHIEWEAAPEARVVVEALDTDGAFETHYAEPPEPRARISGLPGARRHYFRLRDQLGNEVMLPERRLGLAGSPNFRDFGGYRTTEGRQVKWGYLFRSGHLAGLSDADLDLLGSLELDLIFDFRQEMEQAREPTRLPRERAPRIRSLPIEPGNNLRALWEMEAPVSGPEVMFDFMLSVNRQLAREEAPVYRRMFEDILAADDSRFLVHCAAGKDRTGFAVALVLLALGVPEASVLRDYLLSSRFFNPQAEMDRIREKYGLGNSHSSAILPMLQVNEAYLRAALDTIHEDYPDLRTYLSEVMGLGEVELRELRQRYLETA